MHLGFCRTTSAAGRSFSEYKVFRLVLMTNRGMRSRPDRNSLIDDKRGLPESSSTLQDDYEKQFPSLSASISQMPKARRRSRVDLGTCSEQRSDEVPNITPVQLESPNPINKPNDTSFGRKRVSSSKNGKPSQNYHEQMSEDRKNIVQLQFESPNLINDQNDTDLPTSFGKKRSSPSRNRMFRQTYDEHGESKRKSASSPSTTISEPFDICFPDTRGFNSSRNSANRKKWVHKIQSAEENEQNRDNMENENNVVDSGDDRGQVLRPGMVLLKHYIPITEQVDIVNRCRQLGLGPGGFYRPGYNDGAKLRLYMMCLGLDWNPQTRRYGGRCHHDNVAPPDIPNEFTSLVCRVLDDSHAVIKRDLRIVNAEEILPGMSPDVCIVNFYNTNGRLGLHQDRDESKESLMKGLPVVSISVGDSAEFLYGDQRDVDEAESVLLESGDVLVFGGESRHVFHGVKSIIRNTAPPALLRNTRLRPGRLNLTFRKY